MLIYPSTPPQALARVWTAVCLLNMVAKSSSARSREDKRLQILARSRGAKVLHLQSMYTRQIARTERETRI